MTQTLPQTTSISDRHQAIQAAAFQAFATYGYRRTSMDDIAQAAGMSRTALYQHYRNKEDIFRSIAVAHFEEALTNMRAMLMQPGQSRQQALYGCFDAKDGNFMEVVLSTPHGAELLDAGFSVSGDVVAAGEARMAQLLASWLQSNGLPKDLGPAIEFAQLVIAALAGLKSTVKSVEAFRSGEQRLAALVARALLPA